MRTFTANFTTQAASKAAKPYQILEVDWGGAMGTKYYLDRPTGSFDTLDSFRAPATGIGNALVVNWPSVSISLKEGQIGATDQSSVTLDDAGGEITAILNTAEQQRCLVTVWRMFDNAYVQWPADAARIFTGVLRPFDYTAKDNQITLNLGDLGPLLAKDISCIATSSVFSKIPQSSQDKNIPLCWGRAQRVEALPISVPWETKIAAATAGGNSSETVNITDHPSDLPGVAAETAYEGYIGTQKATITFHQSANPTSTLSTATLSVPGASVVAQTGGVPLAANLSIYAYYNGVAPWQVSQTLDQTVTVGDAVLIYLNGAFWDERTGCTVASITRLNPGDVDPTLGWAFPYLTWRIGLTDNAAGDVATAAAAGYFVSVKFIKSGSTIGQWPAGTALRPKDQTTIYAISALPSKAVQIVEGFGSITDSTGNSRKDFVVLGQTATQFTVNSSTTTVFSDWFTVNLNDSTWNAALGRNITTITFPGQPRDMNGNLEDNRIWCTVLGVESVGDGSGSLITNPANVILQYLQNTKLMNVASGSIDLTSFTNAAAALSGYVVGFPQLETKPGLQLLQEIAAQCNSILLFDQGKASMVVLSDTAGTIRRTFDTTTNDNLLQGSLSTAETSVDDLVNEVIVKWTPFWDDKTGKTPNDVRNYKTAAITALGRISREIPIYLYWRRSDVVTQRDWWLNHLCTVFRTVKFTAFLDALILQPGDWINVIWIDGGGRNLFGGAKSMMVLKCVDTGKDGQVEIEARYAMFTY